MTTHLPHCRSLSSTRDGAKLPFAKFQWLKPLTLLCCMLGAVSADTIPVFRTAKQAYKNVIIKTVEPDGIRILHESGITKVAFGDLTPEQRVTYGLTEEKRIEYARRQEAVRLAAKTSTVQINPTKSEKTIIEAASPRYVTSQEIKIYWFRKLPVPGLMESGYHKAIKAREAFVEEIRAGEHDLAADKTAASYNKEVALRAGDLKRANLCEDEIARITQQENEIYQQKMEKKRLAETRMQMLRLDSRLSEINNNLSQLRSYLQY